jgi:Beta-propeller repeat
MFAELQTTCKENIVLKRALPILCLSTLLATPGLTGQSSPNLLFSTYLGGSDREVASAVAVDASGRIHGVGYTDSADFPVVGGIGDSDQEEGEVRDAVAFRLGPAGNLVFSSYFGDDFQSDFAEDVALGADGRAYVAGWWTNFNGDIEFTLKRVLGSQVSQDLLQEYGDDLDIAEAVAVGPDGKVHLAGITCSSYIFGVYRTFRCDGFLLTWVEGQGIERVLLLGTMVPHGVTVDAVGNVYVVGEDYNPDAGQRYDVSVLKISPAGTYLYSALFGGTGDDQGAAIEVDAAGNAYVTGSTRAADFPVLGGVQSGLAGDSDAFVLKVGPAGALVYSTYLGGAGFDAGQDIAVEPSGGVAVTGRTSSQGFPRRNPLTGPCPALCGSTDAFVARLAPSGSDLVFSTFLGGTGEDSGFGIDVDPQGNLVVAGWTSSSDFSTVHAVQPTLAGASDAFVTKIGFNANRPPDCSSAQANPSLIWPPNGRVVPVAIQGVGDPDGGPVALRITGISQDEPGAAGSGVGTPVARVKAERDGKGDGRVYHIAFEAADPAGAVCSGEVTVCVPHDMGKKMCGDGGGLKP